MVLWLAGIIRPTAQAVKIIFQKQREDQAQDPGMAHLPNGLGHRVWNEQRVFLAGELPGQGRGDRATRGIGLSHKQAISADV